MVCVGSNPDPGGAAFLLASPPERDLVLPLDDGEIEIRRGVPYVVARFQPVQGATEAFSRGQALVQRALDMMSILGVSDAVIRDAEDEYLIWWSDARGLVLRAVSTTLVRLTVPSATVTRTDMERGQVGRGHRTPRYHVSFRYFRLAQTTEDLFDAYRNMYLAFEVLLSTQYPIAEGEREAHWLRRALQSASTSLRLDTLKVPASSDPIRSLINKIYRDARLPLFHAKQGRPHFAPQDPASRRVVSDALATLTHIVLRMVEAWFGARRAGGGVFFGWLYENVQRIIANCRGYASSFDGVFDPAEQDISHPRFGSAAMLECRLAPELQRGREPAILSTALGEQLDNANPLRRVELVSGSTPVAAHLFEAPVDLEGVYQFEDLMHVRGMNTTQPRSLFRR
jgi:methylamine utilization protein MauJ